MHDDSGRGRWRDDEWHGCGARPSYPDETRWREEAEEKSLDIVRTSDDTHGGATATACVTVDSCPVPRTSPRTSFL